MRNPTLQFDFHLKDGKKHSSIAFTDPIDIITTNDMKDVKRCFEHIRKAIKNGYYVAGYLSYEVTYSLFKVERTIDSDIPLLWFGVFNHPLHKRINKKRDSFSVDKWILKENKEQYFKNVREILQLIERGVTEQVNYTIPFETTFKGDSLSFYEKLKLAQEANFCAYIQLDQLDILSVSPELFFSIEDNEIVVRPMKGTTDRGKTYDEDLERFNWLKHSDKNKFENDLITNLMKSELKAITENVEVTERYTIEKYPTVYQMTSTIKGRLKKGIDSVEALKQLFPSGSITGIPKKETVEIIANIEKSPRGVYCGAIGYFTPKDEAIFNVPIRTVTIHKKSNRARYYAGGAITKASTVTEEFNETITKTNVLTTRYPTFQLLETLLLEDGELFLKDLHCNRLLKSSDYFNFSLKKYKVERYLKQLIKQNNKGKWRIRLLVNKFGKISSEIYPLDKIRKRKVKLADEPIDMENIFLYHKTTERSIFEQHRKNLAEDELDILLWNARGEITEFTIGNVVVRRGNELITPPVSCGLLPGTFREHLLMEGKIVEGTIYKDEIPSLTDIWLINSVRKWVKVHFTS